MNKYKLRLLKYFRIVTRHLTVRLITLFLIAIVPLNVISIVLINQVISIYQEKLIDSYQGQLDIYVSNINAKLEYLNNSISEYLNAENVLILTLGSQNSESVEFVRINSDIKRIRNSVGLRSISYVINNETHKTSVSYAPNNYDYNTISKIYTTVNDLAVSRTGNDRIIKISDKTFVNYRYDFEFYSFGIMIETDSLLKGFYAEQEIRNESVFMLDISTNDAFAKFPITLKDVKPEDTQIELSSSLPYLSATMIRVIPQQDLTEHIPMLINYLRSLALISVIALPLIWFFITILILNPLRRVFKALHEIEQGNLEYRIEAKSSTYQMDYIYQAVNNMAEEINKLIVDSYEKEIAKLQTDSLNLRLQVRPHMLLNSLNTIYGLSQSGDNDKIMEFSRSLIDYFRYVLRQETKLVRISDEIELIMNYLKIQKIRFPDCFTTVLDIDEEAADIRIPPLIIENFVENSTKYGLIMGSSIEISISVKKLNEYILVIINDTGSGMDRDTLTKLQNGEIIEDRLGSHIGIWNCRRRLKLYYGDEAKLNIESSLEQGTRVEMKLPLEALDIQDSAGKNFSG